MAKKRAIVSYDKLTAEQKRELYKSFPDGYGTNMTQIKTPTGETMDALIWETEEIIYLVKITRMMTASLDDDDDDEDEDLTDLIKPDDIDEDVDDEDDDIEDVIEEDEDEDEDED